jgi:hypothetical protein
MNSYATSLDHAGIPRHQDHRPTTVTSCPSSLRCLQGDPALTHMHKEMDMGKYFIGWLLGVPAIVLVLLYLVFH